MRYVRILALVALCLAYTPTSALAVTGYDSAYAGESAFVMIDPGQTQSFQVFFSNTGTLTWAKGTATQVDLAACLEDKVTCNTQDPSEATWASGWISTGRYATTTQATVAPGAVATFTYNIKAPANATGTHRFNGDLVVASSGARIHPQGYYQDATVTAVGSIAVPTPTPTPGSTPFPSAPPSQPPAPTPTPTPGPDLQCFDGTTDTANGDTQGAIYGGVCTKTGARSATLNNVPPGRDGAYSGVNFSPDPLKGVALADVSSLSFNFTGSGVSATGPRFTIPVDGDIDEDALDGAFDFYITIEAPRDCNDGAGFADAVNDATCTIYTLGLDPANEGTVPLASNWAEMVAAHPNWQVSNNASFIISDGVGAWNLSNVHIGN
jgi:hypothetical protein